MCVDAGLTRTLRVYAAAATVAAASCICSCFGGEKALGPTANLVDQLIVSDPAALQGATVGADGTPLAYVSVSPGTFPAAQSVIISNRRTGASMQQALVGGGLDPIGIPATAGDTVRIEAETSGDATVAQASRVVPAALRPTIVRTQPPRVRDQPKLVPGSVPRIVLVVFSEPMDPATVDGSTIRLLHNGAPVSGQVVLSADGLSAFFEPAAPLAPLTAYTLAVGPGITDTEGESLDPLVVNFVTGDGNPVVVAGEAMLLATEEPGDAPLGQVVLSSPDGRTLGALSCVGDEPSWSPDRSSVVAVSGYTCRNGTSSYSVDQREVFTMNPDGTDVRQITFGDGDAVPPGTGSPRWSPDGARIMFGSARGLEVVDPDGSNRRPIPLDPLILYVPSADWSPDGTHIVFEGQTATTASTGGIFVMREDGSSLARIAPNPTGKVQLPRWSPDGRQIAFMSGNEIFVVAPDGTSLVQLTNSGGTSGGPVWSPDSRTIAYYHWHDPPDGTVQIMLIGADGSGQRQLEIDGSPAGPLRVFDWK